ncbi:MAG: Uncharacterized protein G01um101413_891 [Parcubacteria group bacterium Gr01-1014_13]|nr:MAG: Uncharacterized protein G01um101413_891 [Parcubacteria group bacterium Gr01-1014_13]
MKIQKNCELWEYRSNWGNLGQLNLGDKLNYLCLLAHLAPSSHNTQPWRFFIDEANKIISVYLDREFVLSASDIDGRQAVVSIGCAVENLICGAKYLGMEPTIKLLTSDKKKVKPFVENEPKITPLLEIKFTEVKPYLKLEKIVKAIFNRKVIRAEYDPQKPVPDEVIDLLKKTTDEKMTKLHLITDSLRRLGIAELQSQADAFVINSPKFSKELGQWFLPNDTANFVGMPGISFGLPDDQALRMHNGLLEKTALQPEDGLKFALAGKIGLEKSPLIGIITTKNDDIKNWLLAGRSFEKIFLTLTDNDIQVAVHAGIIEVPLIKRIFSATLGTTRHITVLFRAGYVKKEEDKNRPHSPRLPLAAVILSDKS